MDEDDNLEAEEEINLKINPDLSDEMQDMLYDQLTQYTTKELLADVKMGGPEQRLEPLRKAMAYGKKKTADNVHRSRNRVRNRGNQWANLKNDTEAGKRTLLT